VGSGRVCAASRGVRLRRGSRLGLVCLARTPSPGHGSARCLRPCSCGAVVAWREGKRGHVASGGRGAHATRPVAEMCAAAPQRRRPCLASSSAPLAIPKQRPLTFPRWRSFVCLCTHVLRSCSWVAWHRCWCGVSSKPSELAHISSSTQQLGHC
jgi:hypothetical protein